MNRHSVRALHFLIPFVAWLAMSGAARAGEPLVFAPARGSVTVYAGTGSADHYYGLEGQIKKFDTVGTSFRATTFGVTFRYGLLENLEVNAELPIGYFSVTSKSRFPDRNIFSPVYLGVGATYQLLHGGLDASISSMLKVPPGFHNGIYDDPRHPTFLSDGYLQLTTMLNLGFHFGDYWFKGSGGYNWRGEEPSDEIVYTAEIGLSRVEGTGIFVGCDGVASTADVSQPLRPFYAGASGTSEELAQADGGSGAFRTIDRENYIGVHAGAYVALTEHITLSGNFSLRLAGTNSLDLSGAYLAVGYNF